MDSKSYAETVIAHLYRKTLDGSLEWKIEKNRMSTELVQPITVFMRFQDNGVDSAAWNDIAFSNPVGAGLTIVGNPDGGGLSQLADVQATGTMLNQMNLLFERLVLEPRRKQTAEVIAKLMET